MKLAGTIKVDFVVKIILDRLRGPVSSEESLKREEMQQAQEERDRAHPNHAGTSRSSEVASTLNFQIEHSPGGTFCHRRPEVTGIYLRDRTIRQQTPLTPVS